MSLDFSLAGWLGAPAALPASSVSAVWMHGGWSVVLAWLGMELSQWIFPAPRGRASAGLGLAGQWPRAVALVLMVWACVPGPWGIAFWLGLAFQSPSVLTVGLAAAGLWRRMGGALGWGARWTLAYWAAAIALGWVLLLDSFALWPIALYGWGFEPIAVVALSVAVALPMAIPGTQASTSMGWRLALIVLLLYVMLRLPTGNVWDAVLDPWGWVALQVLAVRRLVFKPARAFQ